MVPSPSDRPPSVGFFKMRDLPAEQLGSRPRTSRVVARITATDSARPDVHRRATQPAPDGGTSGKRFRPSTAPARGLSPQMVSGARAQRVAVEVSQCGPGGEQVYLATLRSLGTQGLEALVRGFPGALWFDRNDAHARPPRGRDVSAIASVLHALAPASLPHVERLLASETDDVRYYATLLAVDLAHECFLEPLEARLFDVDVETARLAVRGIAAIGGGARVTALRERLGGYFHDARRSQADRERAVELLAVLRD